MLNAAATNSYAGYGNDTFSRILELPSINSGLYFRVDKMNSGDNVGDTCIFFGLNEAKLQVLTDKLSSAIGVSPSKLTSNMSGSASDLGFLYLFCAGSFALLFFVFCLLLVTRSLIELKTLGTHLMLGWSKLDFMSEQLFPQAIQLLVLLPIGLVGAFAFLNSFTINKSFFLSLHSSLFCRRR